MWNSRLHSVLSRQSKRGVVILALAFTTYTHMWLDGVNTLVRVCEYGKPYEAYVKFYLYDYETCPPSIIYGVQ